MPGGKPIVLSSRPSEQVLDGRHARTGKFVEAGKGKGKEEEDRRRNDGRKEAELTAKVEQLKGEVEALRTAAEEEKSRAGKAKREMEEAEGRAGEAREESAMLRRRVRSLEASLKMFEEGQASEQGGTQEEGEKGEREKKLEGALHAMRAHLLSSRKENARLHSQLDRFLTRDSVVDLHNKISDLEGKVEELEKEKRTLESAVRKADLSPRKRRTASVASRASDGGPSGRKSRQGGGGVGGGRTGEVKALRAQVAKLKDAVKEERRKGASLQTNLISTKALLTDLSLALREAGAGVRLEASMEPEAVVAAVIQVAKANRKLVARVKAGKESSVKAESGLRAQVASLTSRQGTVHATLRSLYRVVKGGGGGRARALDPPALLPLLHKLLVITKSGSGSGAAPSPM